MYLHLRAYLLVSKYHQANFTSHCIYSDLCKAYDIQSSLRYFPNTYTTSSQDDTDQLHGVLHIRTSVSFI